MDHSAGLGAAVPSESDALAHQDMLESVAEFVSNPDEEEHRHALERVLNGWFSPSLFAQAASLMVSRCPKWYLYSGCSRAGTRNLLNEF
jgi:hypothetical protein